MENKSRRKMKQRHLNFTGPIKFKQNSTKWQDQRLIHVWRELGGSLTHPLLKAESPMRPDQVALSLSIHSLKIFKDGYCSGSLAQHVSTTWLSLGWKNTTLYAVRTFCFNKWLLSLVLLWYTAAIACLHLLSNFPAGIGRLSSGKRRPIFSSVFVILLSCCQSLVEIQNFYYLEALIWNLGWCSNCILILRCSWHFLLLKTNENTVK